MRMKKFLLLVIIIFFGCSSSKQALVENKHLMGNSSSNSNDKNVSPFGGKYEYIYRLIKPVVRDELYFSDANIFVEFVIDESFVHLRLKNKKNEKISVSLNDVQIFISARSSGVINFNYLNEFNYSPATFKSVVDIFPNAFVEFHLAPADNVLESNGDYEVVNFYPTVDFNDEVKVKEIYGNIGKKVGLYLPIETETEIYDYYFEFQIVSAKEAGPYYPKKRSVPSQVQMPSEIVIRGEGLNPSESFIASTLISFFVLISAYFIFAREKGKI